MRDASRRLVKKQETAAKPLPGPAGTALWLEVLTFGYFPFLALVCLGMAALMVFLVVLARSIGFFFWPLLMPAGVLFLALLHVVVCLRVLFVRIDEKDPMELRWPRRKLGELYDLVAEVAERLELEPPDEIRFAADTLAHVYESKRGKRVLVLGGMTVAGLSQQALAGIIAHELNHFTAGDTRASRRALRRHSLMAMLDASLQEERRTSLNPGVWLIRGYHLVYQLAWAAQSREQEYGADRRTLECTGRDCAAATLLHLMVGDYLPWVRLSSVAETCVATNQPMRQIFAEHADRIREVGRGDWREACEKALRHTTDWLDSHPCLRERLQAMGVTPKRALELVAEQGGRPARKLVPDWEEIAETLTDRLLTIYREIHAAKMELGQILRGR